MKIYLSKPRNHWLSPYKIIEFFYLGNVEDLDYDAPWVQRLVKILNPISVAWQWFLDRIHPEIKVIKIDRWDTWSMDCTLTPIILPMLKQLKASKHGSPNVDDADVPEHLQYAKKPRRIRAGTAPQDIHQIDGDDDLIHRRWDWVMDAMIWSFEELNKDDWEEKFFSYTEEDDEVLGGKKLNWDREAWAAHNERIQLGLTLFGKYFRALWD